MPGDRPARTARRGASGPLVAAVCAAVVSAACFVGTPEGDSGDPGGFPGGGDRPPATASPPLGEQEDGTMTAEEFRRDIEGAVGLAEEYWRTALTDSGVRFQPVRRVVPYDEAGDVACGGQPLGLNNAAYCSAGDFIAYDVNWAVAAFRQIGDAFLFYLLGHEYAHGVQVRLGTRYRYTIEQELQADCMAGAYIGDSVRDGALTLQDGDLDELRRGLFAVGDAPDQPWFAEGSHGSPEQRTEAFFNGYERSLPACGL